MNLGVYSNVGSNTAHMVILHGKASQQVLHYQAQRLFIFHATYFQTKKVILRQPLACSFYGQYIGRAALAIVAEIMAGTGSVLF